MIVEWFRFFFKPQEAFTFNKKFNKKPNLRDSFLNILFASMISGAITILYMLFLKIYIKPLRSFFFIFKLNFNFFLIFYLLFILSNILIFFISSGFLELFAKLFRGKSNYTTQTYFLSYPTSALLILTYIFIVFLPLSFLFNLIYIYPLTIILKETHKYSLTRAMLTWFVPSIILAILLSLTVYKLFISIYYLF